MMKMKDPHLAIGYVVESWSGPVWSGPFRALNELDCLWQVVYILMLSLPKCPPSLSAWTKSITWVVSSPSRGGRFAECLNLKCLWDSKSCNGFEHFFNLRVILYWWTLLQVTFATLLLKTVVKKWIWEILSLHEDGEPFSEEDNKPGNQVLADVEKKSYNVTVVKIKVYSTAWYSNAHNNFSFISSITQALSLV